MGEIKRVLIVEDLSTDAELIGRETSKVFPECDFVRAETREEFLTALQDFRPDIILSDYKLPSFDGMSALQIALKLVPETPFIIVTGSMNEDTAVDCMKAGAWDYVIKEHIQRLGPALGNALAQKELRTERRLAREALHESEERFRRLAENAKDIIYRLAIRPNARFEYVSPAVQTITGYTPEEFYADADLVFSMVHAEDLPRLRNAFRGEIRSSQPFTLRWRHRSGDIRWLEQCIIPVYDPNRELIAVEGIARDVTDRKRSEERLRQATNYLEKLITHANSPIVVWDGSFRITEFNKAFQQVSGFSKGKAIGRDISILFAESTRGSVLEYIRTTSPKRPIEAIEVDVRNIDGSVRTLLWSSAPISSADGETTIATIAQAHDITERKVAERELQLQLQRMYSLRKMEQAINRTRNVQSILETLLEEVISQLGVDGVVVSLCYPGAESLESAAAIGIDKSAACYQEWLQSKDICQDTREEWEIVDFPDLAKHCPHKVGQDLWANGSFVSYYAIPLVTKGRLKGVLEIFNRAPLVLEDDWLVFLKMLAGHAAISIEDAQLVEELQNSAAELASAYNATVEGWMKAMDLRDGETEGHSQRVVEMTVNLAISIGVEESMLPHIYRGALLHDVGKLGVPDNILRKPGRLNAEEWKIMKEHPRLAYEMLSSIEYLKPALQIPFCHHEKWDGSGYPQGLMGEEIPIEARIFAVVDVFDALTSVRPYRGAWTKEQALNYILEMSGTHFDPQVVTHFMDIQRGRLMKGPC